MQLFILKGYFFLKIELHDLYISKLTKGKKAIWIIYICYSELIQNVLPIILGGELTID